MEEEEFQIKLARQDAEAALPAGWRLGKSEHERYSGPGFKLDTYSATAEGPDGDGSLAIGLDEAAAWRQLARRLRGELLESEGWAPPLPR